MAAPVVAADATAAPTAAAAAGDTMKCIHCSALGGDIDEVSKVLLHRKGLLTPEHRILPEDKRAKTHTRVQELFFVYLSFRGAAT